MVKRFNKVACLLAVASVMALVPANGAYASTLPELKDQDGSIKHAVAYSGGKILYEGYKGSAENGVYFVTGSTDKKISDDSIIGKFDNKYVTIDDKDNEVFDMSAGKTSEDDIDQINFDAKQKIYKKIKADKGIDVNNKDDLKDFKRINSANFQVNAYSFTLEGLPYVGTEDGNYVTLGKEANLYIYNAEKKSMVKIEKFDKVYYGYKVTCTGTRVLAQSSSKYYVLTTVSVVNPAGTATTKNYIQVVSKAGKADNDYRVPSSVTSYETSEGVYDIEDANSARILDTKTKFVGTEQGLYYYTTTSSSLKVGTVGLNRERVKILSTGEKDDLIYYVNTKDEEDMDIRSSDAYSVDTQGNIWGLGHGIISEYVNGKFVDKYKCDGGYDHLDVYDQSNMIAWDSDGGFGTVSGTSASANSNSGSSNSGTKATNGDTANKSRANTAAQIDIINNSGTGATGNSSTAGQQIDPNGRWAVGIVDPNSVVGRGFTGTTINGKQVGWVQQAGKWYVFDSLGNIVKNNWYAYNGQWYFLDAAGTMQVSKWISDIQDGSKYYVTANGSMATGWSKIGTDWYYFNANGSMYTGWLQDTDGTWYYLTSEGKMAKNTYIGAYKVDKEGKWIG